MIGQRAEHGSSAEHAEPPGFEDWPEISRVETDRFCFRCGYNLHQQSVRRDPRTEVLVSRCPECGTFHPVAVPVSELGKWVQRFKGLLVLGWVVAVLYIAFMAGLAHGVAAYLCLDEFTGYYDSFGQSYVFDLKPWYWEFRPWAMVCAASASMSAGVGFLATTLTLVFLPHWPRRAVLSAMIIWAVAPVVFAGLVFRDEALARQAPHLVSWSMRYLAGSAGCCVAGGLLAMLIGRGLARLIVRIVVPPRWRVYLEGISPRAN